MIHSSKEIASHWETCKVANLAEEVGIDHVRCGVSSKCATGMHTALDEQGATIDSLPTTCVAPAAAEMKCFRESYQRCSEALPDRL